MTIARILSVASIAALASFAAQADTYGANFQSEFESSRTRAEVHAEAVKAVPHFKNFVAAQDSAPSATSRAAVRAEAVTAARARTIAVGNRG
ncbi:MULTISPECIES: DUF4148 domain-containing protein [unclassified Acidovorax]|uniref:DUF4148 domain-containing protein n=1 Tax=unclassified Acidovorax TaxID=2684926 RepID=UPI00023FD388|nr:DUF4148 domain-containing protein [Acidovorax sp. NO-1]EHL21004.1 hypothetical protein KYG_20335 [Acidovorax sp. NO-1]